MQSPGGETRAGTITDFPRRDAGYFKSLSVGAPLKVACEQALFFGKKIAMKGKFLDPRSTIDLFTGYPGSCSEFCVLHVGL